ncbi:MAG TPA: DNA repair protein RecN [Pseudomonadales bacterium]|nr:DNA repair protein RecN [Pseudomonadales bacterium]
MLLHLSVKDFVIAEYIELEFEQGMTVITGETGAGKSIMLDALSLCLGARADAGVVRHQCKQAEVTACFDVSQIPSAQTWLRSRDLLDEHNECMLRRVVTAEGRSRGYVNGSSVTARELQELGEWLIDIHSQHEHQTLLKKANHRPILDSYGKHQALAEEVRQAAKQYRQIDDKLTTRLANEEEYSAKLQLLTYQVDELDKLALSDGEIDRLEAELKQLSNAGEILQNNQRALSICRSEQGEGALDLLHLACRLIEDNLDNDAGLGNVFDMLESARIQIEEASHELQHRIDNFELDPQRLADVDARLDEIYQVARRHRVQPYELVGLQQQLAAELASLESDGGSIEILQEQHQRALHHYQHVAQQLTLARQKTAEHLANKVNEQLQALSMRGCRFDVALHPWEQAVHPLGAEEVEFTIATHPGQTPGALAKIASGGELSRISLAIQVIVAQTSSVATMVFDEVDVGIGGAVAEVVGNLLRQLSANTQVLCVTHLAQVAVKGHQHIVVSKQHREDSTTTQLQQLDDEEKIVEIARMIGGISVSEQTVAHAKAMLNVQH